LDLMFPQLPRSRMIGSGPAESRFDKQTIFRGTGLCENLRRGSAAYADAQRLWRVEEALCRVRGRWMISTGGGQPREPIDFLLAARARYGCGRKRFFRKALGQPHTVKSGPLPVDRTPADQRASRDEERRRLWRRFVSAMQVSE